MWRWQNPLDPRWEKTTRRTVRCARDGAVLSDDKDPRALDKKPLFLPVPGGPRDVWIYLTYKTALADDSKAVGRPTADDPPRHQPCPEPSASPQTPAPPPASGAAPPPEHYLTHFPKDSRCAHCRTCKQHNQPARRLPPVPDAIKNDEARRRNAELGKAVVKKTEEEVLCGEARWHSSGWPEEDC